ncbi:hypothetical protein LCGC14_2303160 [marine sediment metagenome]|uniref:Uncharacterized protein n=1 Tax=marine sediment metagenome TaxID=412755 RepID=A0A0F9DAB4_9ZZZZ
MKLSHAKEIVKEDRYVKACQVIAEAETAKAETAEEVIAEVEAEATAEVEEE